MKFLQTLVLFFVVSFVAAQSPDSSVFHPRLYVYAGGFFPAINTTLRIDGSKADLGTQIGLEDNLKLAAQKTTVRLDAYWDITRRSGVAASFFYLNRSTTLVLNQDITFRDSTYHVGATIKPWFNTAFFSAAYRYSFFSHEHWNAGLSVGINWLQIGTGIEAQGQGNRTYSNKVTFPAPTPFLGIHIQGNLNKHFRARYDFRYFGLTIAGISGRVFENRMMLEYYIFKNIGLGAAFDVVAYNIDEIPFSDRINGNVKFNVNGFSLYVATRF